MSKKMWTLIWLLVPVLFVYLLCKLLRWFYNQEAK